MIVRGGRLKPSGPGLRRGDGILLAGRSGAWCPRHPNADVATASYRALDGRVEDIINSASLNVAVHGAQLFDGAATDCLSPLSAVLADLPKEQAGVRISGLPGLASFLCAEGPIGSIAASQLGAQSRPVRAILFDKTAGSNWSLAWHQDRTICVRQRFETDGFGPWTVKGGMQHVAPPFEILTRMVTLRIHLDRVPAGNAPLLIAPGSHVYGRVPVDAIEGVVRECGTHACLAEAGDIWLYSTPVLHASEAASDADRRRVLQVDYAAEALPGKLDWSGV